MLTGLTTKDGWHIDGLIRPAPNATGGNFSSSYTVSRGAETAFLKAIDYMRALQSPDTAAEMLALSQAFVFERDLCERCMDHRMRHVVRFISHGEFVVPRAPVPNKVSYLIFEMADGDIRSFRTLSKEIDLAWALRTVHQATLGLRELHDAGIAHQDVKPSNLLMFDGGATGKLGDLGRASVNTLDGPYEGLHVAGDPRYAPPEAFYGLRLADWGAHRKAFDLFHLGSLLLFQFTGVNASGAIMNELAHTHVPVAYGGQWTGDFDTVVIYLRDAVSRVADQFPPVGDEQLEEEIRARFLELCEPDPRRRGHPRDHAMRYGDPYSLHRYISLFHRMAAAAERRVTKILAP